MSQIDDWVYSPQVPSAFAASTLFTRTTVALLSGRDAARVLAEQRGEHLVRMRELTAARRTADPGRLLAITYELAHLDADLRWIDEAGRRLDGGHR